MSDWKPPQQIRATAQAVVQKGMQILVYEGFDRKKNERFYRPIGGGVEFLERAPEAVLREFHEETGLEIRVLSLLGILENIYTYEGHSGHDIVQVFHCGFVDPADLERTQIQVIEAGKPEGMAVWKDIQELQLPEVRFYPAGMKDILNLLPGSSDGPRI